MSRYLKSFKDKEYNENKYIPCFWCDFPLERHEATVEHLISKINNGSNKISNLVISCNKCQLERSQISSLFATIYYERVKNYKEWAYKVKFYIPLITKYRKKYFEKIKNKFILKECLYELETILNRIIS